MLVENKLTTFESLNKIAEALQLKLFVLNNKINVFDRSVYEEHQQKANGVPHTVVNSRDELVTVLCDYISNTVKRVN
tara:strand:+ start:103 stop:333 length:231 start_codon:yes stop_codon:yes gene_type:complete